MKSRYKWPGDWRLLGKDFQRVFGMSIVDFYDAWLSGYTQRFRIDILKLDERLHVKFGDYEEQGLSMEEVVRHNYGDKGIELLEQLI